MARAAPNFLHEARWRGRAISGDWLQVSAVADVIGGCGASGNGTRIGGPANREEFTQWQWLTVAAQAPNYPF